VQAQEVALRLSLSYEREPLCQYINGGASVDDLRDCIHGSGAGFCGLAPLDSQQHIGTEGQQVSLINGKPAVEWTFDRETVLSPNLGPDPSDFYWQINAPCLPWPACAYEPPIEFPPISFDPPTAPISFDPPTAVEPPYVPPHTEQPPPYVPPQTPDVTVPLPGTLALLVLGAIMLLSTRVVGRSASRLSH